MCDWNQLTIETVKELQKNSDQNASFSLDYDILPLFKQKYPLVVIDYNLEKTKKCIEKVLSSSGQFRRTDDGTYSLTLNKKNVVCDAKAKGSCSKKGNRSSKKKPLSQWCHQCKQKHNEIVYCSKFFSGSCTKKYCKGCIERHYSETYDNIHKDKWICLFCRNLCVCAFCRRKRGEDVPKKVTKRKKSDIVKESPPTSPKKKVKRAHKKADKEVVLSSPLNSPISPTIPVVSPTMEVVSQITENKASLMSIREEIEDVKMENISVQALIAPPKDLKMGNTIESILVSQNIINNSECDSMDSLSVSQDIQNDLDMSNLLQPINMDISLSQLMKHHFIKNGDNIVFIQKTIFTGVILENGYIKLGWCDYVVPTLANFIECCGVNYTIDCLDSIYCNGETLKKYVLTFNQLYPDSAYASNVYDKNNYNYNNVMMNTMDQNNNIIYYGDKPVFGGLDSEYQYIDIPKEYILDNIFDDLENHQVYY